MADLGATRPFNIVVAFTAQPCRSRLHIVCSRRASWCTLVASHWIRDEIARRITCPSRFAQIHLNYAVGDAPSPVSVRGRDSGDAAVTQDEKEDQCAHP